MRFARFMSADDFRAEAAKLKATYGHVDDAMLERLEEQRSLIPQRRLRYPDPVERRWERDARPERQVEGRIEPDGARWAAACELERARQDREWLPDPRLSPHPLEDLAPRHRSFLHSPARRGFTRWSDFLVPIGTRRVERRFKLDTAIAYYSSWQLLQFAEVAEMGVRVFLNLEVTGPRPTPEQIAAAPHAVSWIPIHAMRDFRKHSAALDAVVWFAEESERGHLFATQRDHRRRMLAADERDEIMATRLWAAAEARRRHRVRLPALMAAAAFLFDRWSHWNGEGRPLIADAYKAVLAKTAVLACLMGGFEIDGFRKRLGRRGGHFKPAVDVVWPNWAAEQRTTRPM